MSVTVSPASSKTCIRNKKTRYFIRSLHWIQSCLLVLEKLTILSYNYYFRCKSYWTTTEQLYKQFGEMIKNDDTKDLRILGACGHLCL
ncbi:hypothetical protein DespoDRAFT_02363 [Desulfobacter postgatei 2ac9]|uniref:Uncharacterized protein n=1 Tax=Desulfobacter postgatei 2ac9 TaxID=879212 RepID=I5B414_9BACT|nr:hypothetical protein DespoDRAFT_02363 [Desulfobacter postgatei 2ac9]